jgi:lipopolysaccharide export LptBFGC system permease protein LptF
VPSPARGRDEPAAKKPALSGNRLNVRSEKNGVVRQASAELNLPDLLQYMSKLQPEIAASGEAATGIVNASFKESDEKKGRKNAPLRLAAASTEVHRRLAFTIACLTFPFVGVALSLLLDRWSRLVPFFVGNLVVIVLFYPLLLFGQILGERGFVPALSLAIPNVVLFGLGCFLFRRVAVQ